MHKSTPVATLFSYTQFSYLCILLAFFSSCLSNSLHRENSIHWFCYFHLGFLWCYSFRNNTNYYNFCKTVEVFRTIVLMPGSHFLNCFPRESSKLGNIHWTKRISIRSRNKHTKHAEQRIECTTNKQKNQ